MAATAEVQGLLRFLSQDAKVPLAICLPKINELRKAQLNSPGHISKANLATVQTIFSDEKVAKQILNAAKRVTNPRKRPSTDTTLHPSASKRTKWPNRQAQPSEAELELPLSQLAEEQLTKVTLQTNRAPLVLAFAVTLLKYTMPEQPISSRLSLAQAVVSANSQSKAKAIGLMNENTAEEEGWGKGQPKIKVMGREIAVMRRAAAPAEVGNEDDSQTTVEIEGPHATHETFWGLDLDALRKSNGPLIAGKNANGCNALPIYAPEAARNYLLRSMSIAKNTDEAEAEELRSSPARKKPSAKEIALKKEEAAGILLKSLDLLCQSWKPTLSKDELDGKTWSWYLNIRPEIAQGQAGWGQKGQVEIKEILKLMRPP